jgi:hypothetical protein
MTFPDGDPVRPGRHPAVVPALIVALLVLLGAGGAAWWFTVGPGHKISPQPVAAPPPTRPQVRSTPSFPSLTGTPNTAAAYDVGTCFDEQAGSGQGTVQLNPVTCGGNQAVFVINKVVATSVDCDSDPNVNYAQHGYEVPDETANVTYCASLVVPDSVCFVLGGGAPIAPAPCGSGANVVQVLAIESAPTVTAACTDKTDPDVWFYQSPTSGQYACVSRPVVTGTPTPPTT